MVTRPLYFPDQTSTTHQYKIALYILLPRLLLATQVPGEAIQALWQEFNLCADGWGVGPAFFGQLCQAIAKSMGIEPNEEDKKALFSALDTDKVELL